MVSGYLPLPRHPMFWEQVEDCHQETVANRMHRFDLLLRYLHVCDNHNLSEGDKMAKLRRYYNEIDEGCSFLFPSSQMCPLMIVWSSLL